MCRGMAKKFSHNHELLEIYNKYIKKRNKHTYIKRKQVWEMGWGREVENRYGKWGGGGR